MLFRSFTSLSFEICAHGTKMSKERDVNEKWPQDKGDVKTEGVKGNNFNRKRSQNKSVKQQETRKWCQAKTVSRE